MKFLCKLLRVKNDKNDKNESKVERRRRQRKKSLSFGDLSNQSKKNLKRGAGPGCLFKKSGKSPSFCFPSSSSQYIFTRIYIRTRKKTKTKTKALCGTSARGGRRSLAPNRPGSSFAGLSREHARKRERERERARVVSKLI